MLPVLLTFSFCLKTSSSGNVVVEKEEEEKKKEEVVVWWWAVKMVPLRFGDKLEIH